MISRRVNNRGFARGVANHKAKDAVQCKRHAADVALPQRKEAKNDFTVRPGDKLLGQGQARSSDRC